MANSENDFIIAFKNFFLEYVYFSKLEDGKNSAKKVTSDIFKAIFFDIVKLLKANHPFLINVKWGERSWLVAINDKGGD